MPEIFIREKIFLLEIGCGPGANIWFMARERFNVVGIDGSETAISKAKERLQKENLNAQLVIGDIVKMPFEDNLFDGIIDNECLYANNEQNTLLILREISRLLKSDGLFYSRSFSEDMFIGSRLQKDTFESSDITEGPLSGKVFVCLVDKNIINALYSKYFNILSIDK